MKKTIYQQHGFENQKNYFAHLAKVYRVEPERVIELAAIYDQAEVFGALLSALTIYQGETDGIEAFKVDYANAKSLTTDLQCFDDRIYNKIFGDLTSKTKFSYSAQIAQYIVLELSLKFHLDEDEIPNVIFRDLFMDVCDRVCADNDAIQEYYIDKSSLSTLHDSQHLDAMVKGAFTRAQRFHELDPAQNPRERQKFEYAIRYGIIFMISQNYFLLDE